MSKKGMWKKLDLVSRAGMKQIIDKIICGSLEPISRHT